MKRKILFLAVIFVLSASAVFAQQTRKGHFEIVKTDQGKFYFVLLSANGQEILKGYQFGSEDKVREAIAKVKQQAAGEENFDPRSEKEQFYFFLKGAEGKALARSENYTTEAAMKRGIESVRRTAPEAEIKL
jgi:uncharacterized protein YegP (UPF0339 family)